MSKYVVTISFIDCANPCYGGHCWAWTVVLNGEQIASGKRAAYADAAQSAEAAILTH